MRNLILGVVLMLTGCANAPAQTVTTYDTPYAVHTAPTYYIYSNAAQWNNLKNYMLTTNQKTVVINFNGGGGNVNIGWDFIQAMKAAQSQGKTIILHIDRYAASMHAITACYADIITGGGELMFHSVGFRINNTNYRDVLGARDYLYMFEGCYRKGIVSRSETEFMLKGNEIRVKTSSGRHYTIRDPRPTGE